MDRVARWTVFFKSANLQEPEVTNYAILFSAQNVAEGSQLTREELGKLGVTTLGHQMKIIKHMKKCRPADVSAEVGDYYARETLGDGTNHMVKLGVHRLTGETVALKILRKDSWNRNPQKWWEHPTKHEADLLRRCAGNSYVIRLVDALFDVTYLPNGGEGYQTNVLVLEHALCNFVDIVTQGGGPFPERIALGWFQQLIEGIKRCHAVGVMHRDLKPEQILFTPVLQLRISDFNFGEYVSAEELGDIVNRQGEAHPLVGTVKFMAPEVYQLWELRSKRQPTQGWYDPRSADVWGAGVILLFLLTGSEPFPTGKPRAEDPRYALLRSRQFQLFWNHVHQEQEEQKRVDRKRGRWKHGVRDLSLSVKDLIQCMLAIEPSSRYRVEDVEAHPWFQQTPPPQEELYWATRRQYKGDEDGSSHHPRSSISAAPEPVQAVEELQRETQEQRRQKEQQAALAQLQQHQQQQQQAAATMLARRSLLSRNPAPGRASERGKQEEEEEEEEEKKVDENDQDDDDDASNKDKKNNSNNNNNNNSLLKQKLFWVGAISLSLLLTIGYFILWQKSPTAAAAAAAADASSGGSATTTSSGSSSSSGGSSGVVAGAVVAPRSSSIVGGTAEDTSIQRLATATAKNKKN